MIKNKFKTALAFTLLIPILFICSTCIFADSIDNDREKEPFEDIGENYYKEVAEEDILYNEEHNVSYVKNQLLISAMLDTDKQLVLDLIDEIDAELVGFIELTNDYQIEFKENKNIKELEEIANYIDTHSFVAAVTLNIVFESDIENNNTEEIDSLDKPEPNSKRTELSDKKLDKNSNTINIEDNVTIEDNNTNIIIQILHKISDFIENLKFLNIKTV